MDISERKKKILRAIVDGYILNAEPVASKALIEALDMDISSATVRNEMAELEALGYLEQPHTSAGRVPSHLGYRLYVDELMKRHRLSKSEMAVIDSMLDKRLGEIDRTLSDLGTLVSRLTNYTAYAMAAHSERAVIRRVELLIVESNTYVAVLVLGISTVRNKLIKSSLRLLEDEIHTFSCVLTTNLAGLTKDDISDELLLRIEAQSGPAAPLCRIVLDFAVEAAEDLEERDFHLGGTAYILEQPEYHDILKARRLLEYVSDKREMSRLPIPRPGGKVKIIIGPENIAETLKDSSVIMAGYSLGDGMQGLIGIVGPTRMNYSRMAAKLNYFSEKLSKLMQQGFSEEDDI